MIKQTIEDIQKQLEACSRSKVLNHMLAEFAAGGPLPQEDGEIPLKSLLQNKIPNPDFDSQINGDDTVLDKTEVLRELYEAARESSEKEQQVLERVMLSLLTRCALIPAFKQFCRLTGRSLSEAKRLVMQMACDRVDKRDGGTYVYRDGKIYKEIDLQEYVHIILAKCDKGEA